MVADKFPNGLIGPIGLRIIRTIRRGYHFPRIPPLLAPLNFLLEGVRLGLSQKKTPRDST